MAHHGTTNISGMGYACRHAHATTGRFQRLFPDLPPLIQDPRILEEAGRANGPMSVSNGPNLGTASGIPLGFCFLGQFIDHDITLDISSSIDRVNDPNEIENVRTPTLDLDCVYGQGPEASRHQYWHSSSSSFNSSIISGHVFLQGSNDDLPRSPSGNGGAALIGDFRNDENRVISQLQLLFLRFHNTVMDHLLDDLRGAYAERTGFRDHLRAIHEGQGNVGGAREELFAEARRMVRWHYQWIVVHDFLKRVCGEEVVDDILCNGRKVYTCKKDPFIPVEFAVAAYRFGHTLVPKEIDYGAFQSPLFGGNLGSGFERIPGSGYPDIDWRRFFGSGAQPTEPIDTILSDDMLDLPFLPGGAERSLAVRNMLRSQSFGLPSGQTFAQAMRDAGCKADKVDFGPTDLPREFQEHAPLWVYVLAEGLNRNGEQLGDVGGRLIAEVLIGLLECDPTSYLGSNRAWVPELLRNRSSTFDMDALVDYTVNRNLR